MNSIEKKALRKYRDALRDLAKIGVEGAEQSARLCEELESLALALPLQASISPDVVSAAQETSFREIASLSAQYFYGAGTPDLVVDRLEQFEDLVTDRSKELPDLSFFLWKTARRWLSVLRGEKEQAFLLISFAVSLNRKIIEEDIHAASEGYSVCLPVSVENRGQLPASAPSIYLHFSLGVAAVEGADWIDDKDSWMVRLPDIDGGARIQRNIVIRYRVRCELGVWVESRWPGAASSSERTLFSNRLEFPLHIPTSPLGVQNPYIADLPLISDLQRSRLVGHHRGLVVEICDMPWSGVQVLRGCRRAGKTTVLRLIERELVKSEVFIPISFDVLAWWDGRKDESDSLSSEHICYGLAACARGHLVPGESTEIADCLTSISSLLKKHPDFRLSLDELCDIAMSLSRVTERKLVFLIDELDIPVLRSSLRGDASSILKMLSDFSHCASSPGILVSHDWSSRGWNLRGSMYVSMLARRIPFLGRPDIERLGKLSAGVQFTALAIDYAWRASGGWPGLAQFIFYRAVEALEESGGSLPIDVKRMKEVVDLALESEDRYLSYMFESVNMVERRFIRERLDCHERCGLKIEAVSEESLVLETLIEKELVQVDGMSGSYGLRVGLLADFSLIFGESDNDAF